MNDLVHQPTKTTSVCQYSGRRESSAPRGLSQLTIPTDRKINLQQPKLPFCGVPNLHLRPSAPTSRGRATSYRARGTWLRSWPQCPPRRLGRWSQIDYQLSSWGQEVAERLVERERWVVLTSPFSDYESSQTVQPSFLDRRGCVQPYHTAHRACEMFHALRQE